MNKWEESETRRCQPIIRADDQALYQNTKTIIQGEPREGR